MKAQKLICVALIFFFLLSQWNVGLVFGEEKKVTIAEAEKEKKLTIAVVDFANTRKDPALDYLVKGIPESIITYLGKKGEVHIVERSRLQSALDEMELQMSDIVDEQTAVQLGKQVGANAVLVGSFLQIGDMIRINSRLIDIETSEIIAAEQVQGALGKEIFGLMDEIAEATWRELTGRPPEEEKGTLEISLAFLDEKGVKLPSLPTQVKATDIWKILVSAESASGERVRAKLSIGTKQVGGSLKVPLADGWIVTALVYKGDILCYRGKSLPVDIATTRTVPVTMNVIGLDTDGDGFYNDEDLFPNGNAKIQVVLKRLTIWNLYSTIPRRVNPRFEIRVDGEEDDPSSWEVDLVALSKGRWNFSGVFGQTGQSRALNWSGTVDIADTTRYHVINITLWDYTPGLVILGPRKSLLDLDPGKTRDLTLTYDLITGTFTGDDTDGMTDGRKDGIRSEIDAYLEYEIKTVVE